jgi:predicted DCC family thiol-disulfide oxidoreductase YuxK
MIHLIITGQWLIQQYKIPGEIDSVILLEGDSYYKYSSAAIRIAKYLDWPAKLIYILIIIPAFIRQPIYKWISRNRYRWFGRRDTCRLPAASDKERFLDQEITK